MANSDNFFSLLGGVAAGFVLGVLFAPEKGSTTRKMILEKFDEYSEDISEEGGNLINKIQEKLHLKPSEMEQRIDSLLEAVDNGSEETIEMLERKLAQLKEANKNLNDD